MTLLETLYSQGVRAWREPRAAAADVLALSPPREALIPAMLLVTVLSVIINAGAEAIAPSPLGAIPHFQLTVFMLALFVAFAMAVCKIGRAMGGIGHCSESLLLAIFFQAIFVLLRHLGEPQLHRRAARLFVAWQILRRADPVFCRRGYHNDACRAFDRYFLVRRNSECMTSRKSGKTSQSCRAR